MALFSQKQNGKKMLLKARLSSLQEAEEPACEAARQPVKALPAEEKIVEQITDESEDSLRD